MHLFDENRAYFGLGLSGLSMSDPISLKVLLHQTMNLFEKGHLRPLWPATAFDAEKIEDAFCFMQRGVHMGRLIVRIPEDYSVLPITPIVSEPCLRANATYVLAGAMGGRRRFIIRWMMTHGAEDVIIVSRYAGNRAEDRALVTEMEEDGCNLHCFATDIVNIDCIQSAVNSIGNQLPAPSK